MEPLTRDEVRELMFSAHTYEQALHALEAGKRWLQDHPDDLVLGMELSMVDRLASSFMPGIELDVGWSTVGRPPPQGSWTMFVAKASSKCTEQGESADDHLTREEVRELIFGATTRKDCERAMEAGRTWLANHPDDTNLQDELGMIHQMLDSFDRDKLS